MRTLPGPEGAATTPGRDEVVSLRGVRQPDRPQGGAMSPATYRPVAGTPTAHAIACRSGRCGGLIAELPPGSKAAARGGGVEEAGLVRDLAGIKRAEAQVFEDCGHHA